MVGDKLQMTEPASTLAPLLVNERDARQLLGGLCAKTMYNLRRSGELAGVKIGSRTMYDLEDLRAFVEQMKHGPSHECAAAGRQRSE